MTRIITQFLLTSASAFAFTSSALASSAPAPVQHRHMTLLPDIPAEQIARDVKQSYDSQTGILTLTAQTFDPFEQDSTLAGTAALRLGPSAVPLNGSAAPTSGGAFLDLTMIYTRPSNNPYDVRGFDRAVYISGEPISRIRQDIRTLDCASNTTEVIYEDNYYDHYAPYGLLAGLYLALPRYRGHRGYWSGQSYRRPHRGWSQWRKRARSYGAGRYTHDRFGGDLRDNRADNRTGNRGRTTRDGRGRNGQGRDGLSSEDRRSGGVSGARGADRQGSNAREGRRTRHSGENIRIGRSGAHREYVDRRGVSMPRSHDNAGQQRPERTNERRSSRREREDRVRGVRNRAENARTARQRTAREGRAARRAATTTPAPIARQPSPAPIARSAPPAVAAPVSRPAPASRPAKRAEPRRESRRDSRRDTQRESRPSRRIDRAVDRSFKRNQRAAPRRQRNFFPALGGFQHSQNNYGSVHTDYRCVREESVTLHIPQERLDAARFDGLTLVLVDNADRDVAVYIPPNYIEGFRQAAGENNSGTVYQAPQNGYGSQTGPQIDHLQGAVSPPAAYPQN